MKKSLKKLLIIIVAVICSFSVHISVSAESGLFDGVFDREKLSQILDNLFNGNTTTDPDNNQNPDDPNNKPDPPVTTTDPTTSQNPFDPPVVGSGTVTTTGSPIYDFPTSVTTQDPGALTMVTTTEPEEESSLNSGSLSELLSQDNMDAIIVQSPTEPFTLGGGLVDKKDNSDDFTWQKAALIAAAVLFVVLAALVVALLVQRSKNSKDDDRNSSHDDGFSDSSHSGPVPVEVMSRARIEELLGSSSSMSYAGGSVSSEESAAAIKTAVLMGQLTHTYSDPLIRKYTDEPVMISPNAPSVFDSDDVSGAQILKATDSMLDDITGNEKYASDISGVRVSVDDFDAILSGSEAKICPECGKTVTSDDLFCHSCGAYIG